MIRTVLMPVRIAPDLDRHPKEIRIQKYCFMQLTEQEFIWAILGILEKSFAREIVTFCLTLSCFDADPDPDPDRHQTR